MNRLLSLSGEGGFKAIYFMTETVKKMEGILSYLKWGNVSRDYFGLSRGWIYQRLNGYDGNGNECDFTESQKETLRGALRDLSVRFAEAAESI